LTLLTFGCPGHVCLFLAFSKTYRTLSVYGFVSESQLLLCGNKNLSSCFFGIESTVQFYLNVSQNTMVVNAVKALGRSLPSKKLVSCLAK